MDRDMEVRLEALKLAAQVVAHRVDNPINPNLWSATVFFESYLREGSEGTKEFFGPQKGRKKHKAQVIDFAIVSKDRI